MWGETESVAVTNECALLVRKWLYGFVCVCIIYTHICVFKVRIFLCGFYTSLWLKIVYVKKNYLVLSCLSWSSGGSKLAKGSIMEARWLQPLWLQTEEETWEDKWVRIKKKTIPRWHLLRLLWPSCRGTIDTAALSLLWVCVQCLLDYAMWRCPGRKPL